MNQTRFQAIEKSISIIDNTLEEGGDQQQAFRDMASVFDTTLFNGDSVAKDLSGRMLDSLKDKDSLESILKNFKGTLSSEKNSVESVMNRLKGTLQTYIDTLSSKNGLSFDMAGESVDLNEVHSKLSADRVKSLIRA
jgi:hypothetical protein